MNNLELYLTPAEASKPESIKIAAARRAGIPVDKITALKIRKKSIDARKKPILVRLAVDIYTGINPVEEGHTEYLRVSDDSPRVVIIGCGPAGMFAALRLLENGIKPILLERGKDVKTRRRDLAAIHRERVVNPDSNYCFGEGGAGTYSDGKLYTRSNKRGDIPKILRVFLEHGAAEEIAYEAHPHIGTNKLPAIVTAMSDTIRQMGGEIHFSHKVINLLLDRDKITAVQCADGSSWPAEAVILATGHSSRDIFEMLHSKGILITTKPFALGVRIEHPQQLIDRIQYHCEDRDELLPPSSYSLVEQVNGRGVFSFCMCPGGIIAPAMTAPGEIVVNGWSPSKRNNPYANSGMVVALNEEDFTHFTRHGPLAAMAFQAEIEKKAFVVAGRDLNAPAQRMSDFINRRISSSLPEASYIPGIVSASLDEVLPGLVSERLRLGLKAMGKKMRGYETNEAVLVGVESRTSSPVKIPRNDRLEHPQIVNLYPCGEGAGYAGGIVSAAMDGVRCATAAAIRVRR